MKEIVVDFRRYKDLGFSVREAVGFARMRARARSMLKRHERGRAVPALPAQPSNK